MDDLAYWTRKLQEAERELEAATRRSDVNAATRRLMAGEGRAAAARAEGHGPMNARSLLLGAVLLAV